MADDIVLPGTGQTVAAKETGGKKYQRIILASTGGFDVLVTDVSGIGSGPYAMSVLVEGQQESMGDIAAGDPDTSTSYPLKIGGVAANMGGTPGDLDLGARGNLIVTRHGVPFVLGGDPAVVTLRATYTATQTNAAIVAVTANNKILVTRISVQASAALTAAASVLIGFAAATTPTTTGVVYSHPGIGGAIFAETVGTGAGMLGCGADGEDLRITTGTISAGALDVIVTYLVLPA